MDSTSYPSLSYLQTHSWYCTWLVLLAHNSSIYSFNPSIAHFIHHFFARQIYTPLFPLIPVQSPILSHNLICLKPIISADRHKHRDDDCHLSRCIRLWRVSNLKPWSSPLKLQRYKYINFPFPAPYHKDHHRQALGATFCFAGVILYIWQQFPHLALQQEEIKATRLQSFLQGAGGEAAKQYSQLCIQIQ